jgi:ABC-type transporter Mla subunit MlaD
MGLLGDIINVFEVQRKEKLTAYIYLIVGGFLGGHEFYLEKKLRGFLYVVAYIILLYGWGEERSLLLACIGSGVLLVFWVFDLITLGKQVDKWNDENAGNSLIETAGKLASGALSIPLNNAVKEYNDVTANFQNSINDFNKKKTQVESLLQNLQQARKDALSVVKRIEQILAKVPVKGTDVNDILGEKGELDETFRELMSGNGEIFNQIQGTINETSQEMANTFYAAQELTQTYESNAGKFLALAGTALTVINEVSKQQEKITELKQKREDVLKQQNEVENKTMQLEATEKRAQEILKVINAEVPGFNHIYDAFCAEVFPDGFTEQKELATLTVDQRKMFNDLCLGARTVLGAIKQEINDEKKPISNENPPVAKKTESVDEIEKKFVGGNEN